MKKILFSVVLSGSLLLSGAEKPLLRAGMITDTHVKPDVKSVEKLRAALELFKREKVDVVINLGDVADKFHPEAYRNYRNTVKAVYPNGIREIFAYAGHDRVSGVPGLASPVPYSKVKTELEITHDPLDIVVVNGIPFVTFPQDLQPLEDFEKHLTMAAKKFPGQPLFVVDHRPPYNTTFNSLVWALPGKERILAKFPQVIHLCGHVHNDIRNELCIWQGSFTAVDTGCISGWAGDLEGTIPFGKSSAGVLVMDVFKDKVKFNRWDAQTGKIAAEPWQFPLPHDPQNPPLAFEKRKQLSTAPEFPADSRIITVFNPKNFNDLQVRFHVAQPQKDVFKYEIFIRDKESGKIINRQEIFGDFYRNHPVKSTRHTINAGYFESGREYIIQVVPFNFFGKRGKTQLETSFKAPVKAKWTTVFECNDPMETLKFKEGLDGGAELKKRNGFYIHDVEEARLIFPDNVWTGKAGTRFRFTIDMHTRQSGIEKWTVLLRNPNPVLNANARLYTQSGDLGVRRYVIEFTKKEDNLNYYFLVREGAPGEIRFEQVKIERLD